MSTCIFKEKTTMKKNQRTLWEEHKCIKFCKCHWENCIKFLKLDPLSIAKYFWEKGIDDYALIQDFVYLTYIEALWKDLLLFEERYQAWEEGPVLVSIYQKMRNHYKKHSELDSLFSKIKDVENKTVKACLTKVYRNYQKSKKNGKEIDFFFQVQDVPWESTRENLNNNKKFSNTMQVEEIMASR